jgi:hypothetical protein
MKQASEIKKSLDELRRQIQGLGFYLEKVKTIPTDRNSISSLAHAKNTTRSIQDQINEQMYKLEADIRKEKAETIDASYDDKLKKINSPTSEMLKNSQNLMGSRRESILGGGLMKKSSDGFIRNLKKMIMERAAKRSEDGNRK